MQQPPTRKISATQAVNNSSINYEYWLICLFYKAVLRKSNEFCNVSNTSLYALPLRFAAGTTLALPQGKCSIGQSGQALA
jgi:hypothetical protein